MTRTSKSLFLLIPFDKLASLQNALETQSYPVSSDSIGLNNVHWRIRLQYGANYGLSITERHGVCVTLLIPYDDSNDQRRPPYDAA